MNKSRRGFLGQLGLGAAAVGGGFFGKSWADAGKTVASDETKADEIEKCQKVLNDAAKTTVPEPVDLGAVNQEILQLAQPPAWWVREGVIPKGGHLFNHKFGAKNGVDLGNRVRCTGYRCTGLRAIRLADLTAGRGPGEQYTDPQCDGFKAIVRGTQTGDFHCMYGPVFRIETKDAGPMELFCGNKSLRWFARELGHEPYEGLFDLVSCKVENSYTCTYYTFSVEKF